MQASLSAKESELGKWKNACEKLDNSLKRKQGEYEKELTGWQGKYQNAGKALLKVSLCRYVRLC